MNTFGSDPIALALQGLAEDDLLMTTYVVVVEWVDSDGNRSLTTINPSGQPPWERNGILNHVLTETGVDVDWADVLDGDDEDED